jgi:hypothetical protein
VSLGKVLPAALVLVAVALGVVKLRPNLVTERGLVVVAAFSALAVLAVGLRAVLRRRPPFAGAMALDKHHRTGGRVANALAFSRVPEVERTALMQLAIDDAVEATPALEPRRAVPISLPRESALVALLVAGLVALALFEVRVVKIIPPPPAPPPLLMTADDVELFRDVGEELARTSQGPAQRAAVARYNRLIEDIADRRVDRHEVFRRLGEIERDLGKDMEADREALDAGLEGLARELAKSGLTRKAADAFSEKRLADAEKALRDLAQKLRDKKAAPSRAELDRLRQALERAGAQHKENLQAVEARRRELQAERESLLKKKKEGGDAGADADADRKLEENQRKLERLDRESERGKRAAEKMSELDKELAKAAEDLRKEMGDAAKDLEKSAENVNRIAKKELDDEQKREMIRRLKELREVLRQDSQGGEGRQERLQRFSEKARGGQRPGQGPGGKDGEGQQGGKGGNKEVRLRLGKGDGMVEVPGMGQGQGQGKSPGGEGESPGGAEQGGKEWGTGHDPNLQGKASSIDNKTHDVSAAGIDTGEGSASAEVIYGAAERGFTSKGYKDVFTEYETVAEQVFEKDDIPPGYRFYVRRYFQLIRPRE